MENNLRHRARRSLSAAIINEGEVLGRPQEDRVGVPLKFRGFYRAIQCMTNSIGATTDESEKHNGRGHADRQHQ